MPIVEFHETDQISHHQLKYAVIVSRYQGKWIFCKHKDRTTWEIPAGRREEGELILNTAKRELHEETGALQFDLQPICIYSVTDKIKTYGLLCRADIQQLGALPPFEIERIQLFDNLPDQLTYPQIQPQLFEKAKRYFT